MFVIENTVTAIKSYMIERLTGFYSEREVNYFFKSAVCKRLNLNDTEFLLASNNRLSESDLLFFRNVVKRLQDREPFQYIIGNTWFYDLQFKCDKRALIPRPETEELVDLIIKENQNKSNLNLLDLCSGSGCIAISLAKNLKEPNVIGIEFSQDAIDLSKKNALLNHIAVSFLNGNVFRGWHKIVDESKKNQKKECYIVEHQLSRLLLEANIQLHSLQEGNSTMGLFIRTIERINTRTTFIKNYLQYSLQNKSFPS